MTNAYVTVDTIKGSSGLNITVGTVHDDRLLRLAENLSRKIDRETNRFFYSKTETKTFDGDGEKTLFVPDLIAVTTLKEDSNNDGTFDTTWAVADFLLEPHNAAPTADTDESRPYTDIRVNPRTNGSQDAFLNGVKNYEIIGTWGYRAVTEDSGENGTLSDGTGTSLTTNGTTIEIGQTLLIESEQVYVTDYSEAGGTRIATVERGVNGSTGTAHTDEDLNIVRYPGEIEEACFIMVARLWKRKDSGFASEIGFPEAGQMIAFRGGFDPDVKELLSGYVKPAVGVGI